jgi:hypothetical protein
MDSMDPLNITPLHFYVTLYSRYLISGPQDAAGRFLKRQADVAILCGTTRIQNAKNMFLFGEQHLQSTKLAHTKRRIFRYLESVDRDRDCCFKPVSEIRSIHQIRTSEEGML